MSPPEPRRGAVALARSDSEPTPRVIARGYGLTADAIIRTARAHGVYVHESPELVSLLMQIDLDARIPPALYQAIAELLAWLYRLEAGGMRDDGNGGNGSGPPAATPTGS